MDIEWLVIEFGDRMLQFRSPVTITSLCSLDASSNMSPRVLVKLPWEFGGQEILQRRIRVFLRWISTHTASVFSDSRSALLQLLMLVGI